ncbi:MAG: hydrogenase 4 subunit B [Proteobacteria bacterium]|nr:hydrogenase 4 subunit B [Pseudomonadota bacterium]
MLALVAVLLLALGAAATIFRRAPAVLGVSAALSASGAAAALASLIAGGPTLALALPIGLPSGLMAPDGMTLALDPLSAMFLLILFVAAAFCAVYAIDQHEAEDRRALAGFPAFVGAMALALLAADAFTLVFGFELMSAVSWLLVLARHEDADSRSAGIFYVGMALFGGLCLVPAFAVLAHAGGAHAGLLDLRFSAMRAAPPEGWRAALVLALVLLGAGSKAGLVPLHPWLPLAHPAAPSHVSALMSGAMTKVGLYVIVRVLFDLCGPAQPLWWGIPLIAAGAASALIGALRATADGDIKSVLACSTIENVGLIAVGLGVALVARGADLPALAALALCAALLHALGHGVFKPLMFLCVGSVAHGAGTRSLARLGGLIHRMPVTAGCAILGAACLAGLPVFAGFAGEWLLFQAVLAGPRIGGLALQTLFAALAAVLALSVALAAAAAVRLIGVAFLGRPRGPRAAVADEAGPRARAAMIGLSGLAVLLGLLPGPAIWLLEPALRGLSGAGMAGRAGWLAISPTQESFGYAPAAIALLVALAAAGGMLALRRLAARGIALGRERGPAWANGFAAPPAWLPFGDSVTQYGGASFSEPLQRTLGRTLLRGGDPAMHWLMRPLLAARGAISRAADAMQVLTIRRILTVMFAVLVLFLAVIAAVEM